MAGDVYHLSSPEAWEQAEEHGSLEPPSLAEEGFVHCSTTAQLAGTIARHLPDAERLVLLRVDLDRCPDARWAEVRPGERYPHVHGPIPLDAVVEAVPWTRGDPLPSP